MVNKVINSLLGIYILGFKFGGGDKGEIITDVFFTDDISNRKSLQGYAMRLFERLIVWTINK